MNQSQIAQIQQYSQIIHAPLTTIENYGGGSARCMLAEIFLLRQEKLCYTFFVSYVTECMCIHYESHKPLNE